MRIGLVGGGSGGHFYPLMSVVESLREKYKAADLHLYYFGPNPYDADQLKRHNIQFVKISAGKSRLYSSIENYFDIFGIFAITAAQTYVPLLYRDLLNMFADDGFKIGQRVGIGLHQQQPRGKGPAAPIGQQLPAVRRRVAIDVHGQHVL